MFLRWGYNILKGVLPTRSRIFVLTESVIWQKMNFLHPGKARRKLCNSEDFFLSVVECGNNRYTDYKLFCFFGNFFRIFKNERVVSSCECFVLLAVCVLYIH